MISMSRYPTVDAIPFPENYVFISGQPRDERGLQAVSMRGENYYTLLYDSNRHVYSFNELESSVDDIQLLKNVLEQTPTLIESTTLGFVELLLCLRAGTELIHSNFQIIYVEPLSYTKLELMDVLRPRDFNLTNNYNPFSAIPGAAISSNPRYPTKGMILAGYEGERLQLLLQQTGLSASECDVVFGVPAFKTGWELNSFANFAAEMYENKMGSVLFAGASNPFAVYKLIQDRHQNLAEGERLMLAPLGTKPHAIGAALYSCMNESVGLVYDHPEKRQNRSTNVGCCHLYKVNFTKA